MSNPNLMLFYVKNPAESAVFYERLFGQEPASLFPTYASFSFQNGFHLGLWSVTAKDFVSDGSGNRSELSFMVKDESEVHKLRELLGTLHAPIEQDLMQAAFGLTFVALDPDGHRIRVCLPNQT